MGEALIAQEHHAQVGGPLSASVIRDRVNLIQRVMQSVMKQGTHYDTIPGTDKPTLLKPGAEVLMTTFQISVDPEVQDLSADDVVRYRVRAVGRSVAGNVVGVGIGECSSHEEKYKWRRTICKEEFDATPEERRRIKFARGRQDSHYTIQQIRTETADVANTVLKMAKKRALVDFTLTALAASDIFAQDLEDMPEELREPSDKPQEVKEPQRKAKEKKSESGPAQPGAINETQAKMIRRKLAKRTKDEQDLLLEEAEFCEHFGIKTIEELPMARVNEALQWSEAVK